MGNGGTTHGTVVRWDDVRGGAIIEAAEVPGGCWADRSVVVQGTKGTTGSGELRAGQVVELTGRSRETGACRSGPYG